VSDVDKIKEKLGIVDVIGSYIQVEKAGMGYKAKCPFHNEKTPSFNISTDRNLYYCFGCGARGDIFTFVEEFEGLDFAGALKFLADKAGIQLSGENKEGKAVQQNLYRVMEKATEYYVSKLNESDIAKKYISNRGIKEQTIKDFDIGFAPDGWTNIYTELKTNGLSNSLMEKAGLIKKGDKKDKDGNMFYDRFRNRIMFPIADSVGRVIAFSGRALEKGDTIAKYLNSPETELFNKSDVLYGYDKAKQHIKKANACILVEGQIDLILAHQEGFPYSVAVSGTSFTGSHLSRIKRLTNNLIIAFDRDKAGVMSMKKTAMMALGIGMNVRVVLLPEGKDPADLILEDKVLWTNLVKESKHVVDVFLEQISLRQGDQREYWQNIRKHVIVLVKEIPDAIDRAHFIDEIHKRTGIPEKSINEEIQKIEKMKSTNIPVEVKDNVEHKISGTRFDTIYRKLSAIIIWQSEKKEPDINIVEIKDKIKNILDSVNLIDIDPSDLQGLVFDVENTYRDGEGLQNDIEELMLLLEEDVYLGKLNKLTREMRLAEKSNNRELVQTLMTAHRDISNKLQEIKQKIKSRIN